MRVCVLLVLLFQGISGDEIQRPVTLAVSPQAPWKIPGPDTGAAWGCLRERSEIWVLWAWG